MDVRETGQTNPFRHPWELARSESLLQVLMKLNPRTAQYADIGAGDLYFARQLSRITDERVYAVEPNYRGPRNADDVIICDDVRAVPSGSIDCVTLMDVLEHVGDDRLLLGSAVGLLKPRGTILITVPAHQGLWSRHDQFLGHQRRYSRRGLGELIEAVELTVVDSFYFYFVPLLARAGDVALEALGLRRREGQGVGDWRFDERHPVTRIARTLLDWDFYVNRALHDARLPTMGLSICAVCRRRSAS